MTNPVAEKLKALEFSNCWSCTEWGCAIDESCSCACHNVEGAVKDAVKEIENLQYALNVKLGRPTTYYGYR